MKTEQDLIYWVASFYVLEDIFVRFSPTEGSHARTRLKDDVEEARKNYGKLLANLIFDTLVKMSFGEASHAHDRCGIVIPEISRSMDRKTVYELSEQFDPIASLPVLRDLFLECWLQPYGGSAWAIITETAMKYCALPHEIYIDHCVDLSHHGGLVFDKLETGFHVWHKRKYLDLLDCKRNGSLMDTDLTLPVFGFVQKLLERTYNLHVTHTMPELVVSLRSAYLPVKWGSRILSYPQPLDDIDYSEDFKGSVEGANIRG